MSYPYGVTTAEINTELLKYYTSLRITSDPASYTTDAIYYKFDGNNVLGAINRWGNTTAIDDTRAMDRAKENGEVWVVYMHDITPAPVTSGVMSTEKLEGIIQYAIANNLTFYRMQDLNPPDLIEYTLSASQTTVTESDTTITLTVTGDKTWLFDNKINISTVDGSAVGGSDFNALTNYQITIPAGSTTASAVLSIQNNPVDTYGIKQFYVALSNPTGNATLGLENNTTISIYNMALNFTANINGNEGTDVTGTIDLYPGALPFDCNVTITNSDGTAKAGIDYTAIDEIVTIPAGETTASFVVHLLDDKTLTGDKTFTVTLSSPVNATLGTNTVATITIIDSGSGANVDKATQLMNMTWLLIVVVAVVVVLTFLSALVVAVRNGNMSPTMMVLLVAAGIMIGAMVITLVVFNYVSGEIITALRVFGG
jgi:hypothetical protein